MCENKFEYFLLEMYDKTIHNLKICIELKRHSVTPIRPRDYLFIDPLDGPIDPLELISTTLRTTSLHFVFVSFCPTV